MTQHVKVALPKLGESIVSATVVKWFKEVGDRVELDEPLLEVSTDKVNSEIPSPVAGTLSQILAKPDQEIQVGEIVAIVDSQSTKPAELSSAPAPSIVMPPSCREKSDFLSPSVARLLKEKGISFDEAERIPRTGEGGRLTKRDIEAYASLGKGDTERVKMSAMRKAIAENMVRSFYQAPHASLVAEVDMTRIVQVIQEHKQAFLQQHGAKLTVTPFVARAMARAIRAFPLINASLEQDTIVMKRFVNLGIAVSVEQGVMVPVIQMCHRLTLAEIAGQIAHLAEKARNHSLTADEVQGGSITLTNFGMTGISIGIPIIRYPEVAIVGMGAIARKAVPQPDNSIAIRSIMWLSLTFDHRVLDGLYGCGFLGEVKKILEEDPSLDG